MTWTAWMMTLAALGAVTVAAPGLGSAVTSRPLFDFRTPHGATGWRAVDDRVMGGVSQSRLEDGGSGTARFTGRLSLESNGGFASVRSTGKGWDLRGYEGLVLRVRGDGRRYKATLKTEARLGGILYQAPFQTRKGEWIEVRLPFGEFRPQWRGRPVPEAGPVRRDRIRSLGFLVSDRQEGLFRLEIDFVRAYGPAS